jgi:hypothetical protein
MLVTGRHKLLSYGRTYARFAGWADQVFDLVADPNELADLAPSSPQLLARLQARLLREIDVQAVDRAAMASQFVVHRLQEAPCWRHTRRCFAPELRSAELRQLRAWEREAEELFAAELKAAQLPNGTDLLAGHRSVPSCRLPALPRCRTLSAGEAARLVHAAGMQQLDGLDLPGHDRPCVEASADGRYCCCTVCAEDGAAACARNRAWCAAVTLNRERTYATLKGGLHPSGVRAALVRARSPQLAVLVWGGGEG